MCTAAGRLKRNTNWQTSATTAVGMIMNELLTSSLIIRQCELSAIQSANNVKITCTGISPKLLTARRVHFIHTLQPYALRCNADL